MPRPGSKPEGLSRPYLTGLAVALIFGVAIYFRLYDLGSRNLWTDEAWVALAAMQPTAKEALAAGQSTPPFYLLTLWAMVQLWGHSEMVLRSLSWLFGVGTLWPHLAVQPHAGGSSRRPAGPGRGGLLAHHGLLLQGVKAV